MNGNILLIVVVLIVILSMQALTAVIQYNFVHKKFIAIKKRNEMVTVGKSGSRGRNKTAVLAFDSEGYLNEAYILSGLSVFARLKRLSGHDGEHYLDIKNAYRGNKKMSCIIGAIQYMEVK